MLIGYPAARYPGALEPDLDDQPVEPWLWIVGIVAIALGVLGYFLLHAFSRQRRVGEHDPAYDTRTQRLLAGMVVAAALGAGVAIIAGAAESAILWRALLPVGAGVVAGVVSAVRS